jgi:CheY-like chemotaxis protein
MKKNIKILLVEDKPVIQKLISGILSDVGKDIIKTGSGESALMFLCEEKFDVVILDIKLATSMTGFEMLRQAKKKMLDIPPVIVLSEFDSFSNYREAVNMGVFDFVPKNKLDLNFGEIVLAAVNSKTEYKKVRHCFKHNAETCNSEIFVDKNMVFVGIPFKMRKRYFDGIKTVVKNYGFECLRADEIPRIGSYSCKICALIEGCKFVIFDISELSSNVFLEMGFACAIGKDIFVLKKKKAQLPSNLSGIEPILYDNISDLKITLNDYLKVYLRRID